MAIFLNQYPLGLRDYNDFAEKLGKDPSEMTTEDNHEFAKSQGTSHIYKDTFYAYSAGMHGTFSMKNVGTAINNLLKDNPSAIGYGPGELFAAIGGTGGGWEKREKYGFNLPVPQGPGIGSSERNSFYQSVGPGIIDKFLKGYEQDLRVFSDGGYSIFTGETTYGKQISGGSGAQAEGNYTFTNYLNQGEYDNNPDAVRIMSERNFIPKDVYKEWYDNLMETEEQEAKDVVIGGFEDYADTSGGNIDTTKVNEDSNGDLFKGYGTYTPAGTTNYSGSSPISKDTQLYKGENKNRTYVEGRIPRTTGMRAVLGEEIFNLGLKDNDGNLITPESLSQFATYTTEEGVEKPLIDYENSLHQKLAEGEKDAGVDARSLLATRARQGVMGAASAGGSSLQQIVQDAGGQKLANRQMASSAMSARVSAIEDKQNARKALTKLKSELLEHNLKRENEQYKLKSKTAVGLAGLEETAAQYAKDMLNIKNK